MGSVDTAKCLCCRRSTGRTVTLVVFMILYLIFGAIVFSMVESPKEEIVKSRLRHHRRQFYLNRTSCMTDAEFEEFIIQVVKASERGVSAIANVSSEPNWSFGQSIFFAGTILTTIGYGHTTPLSEGGKVFCIIYAMFGIPLTLVMFTAIVERLMIPSTRILQYLFNKFQHLHSPFNIRLMHLCGVLLIVIVFVFLIPAGIFSCLEDEWNYLDSLYYCFISMATIGLGDYIPGDQFEQKHRALYKTLTTTYLFCGLILMMFTLAVVYEIPELNLGLHFYMQSDDQEEEKQRLRSPDSTGPNYTEHRDDASSAPLDAKRSDPEN